MDDDDDDDGAGAPAQDQADLVYKWRWGLCGGLLGGIAAVCTVVLFQAGGT